MTDLLPIEEGCLAVIIRSKAGNVGKIVTVGKFIGGPIRESVGFRRFRYEGNDRWMIDKGINTIMGFNINHVRGINLMRIDGFKEEEKAAETKIKVKL